MERNFFRRVEIAFPVLRAEHRQRIFEDLTTLLADDTNAWELRADGSYERLRMSQCAPIDAQAQLLERYAGIPQPQPAQAPQPPTPPQPP